MSNPSDLDTRLKEMFQAQSQALRVPPREWADLHDIQEPGQGDRRRRSYAVGVAAFAALVAIVAVSARPVPQTVDTTGTAGTGASTTLPASRGVKVETRQVSLAADSLIIDVGDQTFSGAGAIEAHSDPGMVNEYTTLELTWFEHGVEMRLNIYFTSDGSEWWSNEIRTYDGAKQGEWIRYGGEFFRSSIGTPFVGDLDIRAEDHGVPGRLRLPSLHLEAFRR